MRRQGELEQRLEESRTEVKKAQDRIEVLEKPCIGKLAGVEYAREQGVVLDNKAGVEFVTAFFQEVKKGAMSDMLQDFFNTWNKERLNPNSKSCGHCH